MPDKELFQRLETEIAQAIKPVLRELRLVDVVDYIGYLRFEKHQNITDIFVSSAEQYFAPGFLSYREAGSVTVTWKQAPTIKLEAGISTPKASFRFAVHLQDETAFVEMLAIDRLVDTQNEKLDELAVIRRSISINKVAL